MKAVFFSLVLCCCLAFTPNAHAYTEQIQALEASIREAKAMGLDPAMISQMEAMLAAAKADMERRGASATDAARMAPNHFDVMDARDYGNCEQYSDNHAFGYCQAATHYYLMYTEIFAKEGATEAARQVYEGHVQTVENLIQYVDVFMTAPRN